MEQVAVRELNQHTSRVLARVRKGETVVVTERGQPIARLVPITRDETVLGRLAAEGRLTPPAITGPVPFPPVLGDPETDAAALLAESRDEERW